MADYTLNTTDQFPSPPGCNVWFRITLPLAVLSSCSKFCVQHITPCDLELADCYSFVAFHLQTDSDRLVAARRIR